MKLTIVAATGGIGRQLLAQAPAAGHEVTAVVRNPARLDVEVNAVAVDLSSPWDVAWYDDKIVVAMAGIHQLWWFDPIKRTGGVYAGVALNGSTLRPDNDGNDLLYGRQLTAKEIVRSGEVAATADGRPVVQLLDQSADIAATGKAPGANK